jgi:phosphatidylserine/phosphatidylglycerophosphate/cardiolipin synthase-like enzyme
MSQKNSGGSGNNRSPVTTIISLVVIVVIFIVTRLLGINLGGGTSTTPGASTSAPVATTRPTAVSGTATLARPDKATAVPATAVPSSSGAVATITVGQGFGAKKGFWEVYFTAPTGSTTASTYVGGIDEILAASLAKVKKTLDIAAFEFNSPALTQAVLDANKRGVKIRMVVDTQNALEDEDSTMSKLVKAGIPVVDDKRSAFMHDKFMILDSQVVWMGSWNYTINDTYRNNNNALSLRSQKIVENYQAEFNEMFEQKQFGPKSPVNTPNRTFNQDGVAIQNYFAPEDLNTQPLLDAIKAARKNVRFMAFSFTLDDVGQLLITENKSKVKVQGIFESTGSEQPASELTPLLCAGLDMRQDGNKFVLHHKVFIIDDNIVITGSFNFSANAANSNDDNLLIIQDKDLAAQYLAEFDRRWKEAKTPDKAKFKCS